MLRYIYIILITGLAGLALSCGNEPRVRPGEDPDGAVKLSGVITKADGLNGDNIYLRAVHADNPSQTYIAERKITVANGLGSTAENITFDDGTPYYPLADKVINFYAYSGRADGDNMVIMGGYSDEYDAVLSNTGWRESEDKLSDPPASREGHGTPGSSTDPADILQFRHVMTRIKVDIQADPNGTPEVVDPVPDSIHFKIKGVPARGKYSILSTAPDPANDSADAHATDVSGEFTFAKGVNYVVPNGIELIGREFTELVIDDYKATDADLSGFVITPSSGNGNTTMRLMPGYAYNVTILVHMLKVTAVIVEKVDWKTQVLDDDQPQYDPKVLDMTLGAYPNTGDERIEKVVLRTADRIYVGALSEESGDIEFVVLPDPATRPVVTADLYTQKGLLVSVPITNEYTAGHLNLQLSAAGMFPVTAGSPYNPATNPWAVTTPVQFLNLDNDLSASYRLMANIDMAKLVLQDDEDDFAGFGPFGGTLDGNGFWIAELNIDGPGLFTVNNGTIHGVRILSGIIDASNNTVAGSICGTNNKLLVACVNEASVHNAPGTAGGICGVNGPDGQVIACINTGNVPSGTVVGGICGHNNSTKDGTFSACVNTGSLDIDSDHIGGICGTSVANGSTPIMRTCFWLVGSAQRQVGGGEVAVDSPGVGRDNTSDMDPERLRNYIEPEETDDDMTENRLNAEFSKFPAWYALYEYEYNNVKTGITWPAPMKR